MIDNVKKLIELLRSRAIDLEDDYCSDVSSGLYKAIRIISEELNLDDHIGDHAMPEAENPTIKAVRAALLRHEVFYQYKQDKALSDAAAAFDYQDIFDQIKDLKRDFNNLSTCPKCHGSGVYHSIRNDWDCLTCFGTGRDFGDTENVIIHQQTLIKKQMAMLSRFSNAVYELKLNGLKLNESEVLTDAEKTAISVANFYQGRIYKGD